MRNEKDVGGKWIVQFLGHSLVKLAGHSGFTACRAAQTETVTSRRIPDGLLEVTFPGRPEAVPYVVEIETYPDSDNDRQILEAVMAVYLNRRVVPEVVSVILARKGNADVNDSQELRSRSGEVSLAGRWRTVRMWELDAEALFAMNDVGVIPWIPLTRTTAAPDELIRRCRAAIDAAAPPAHRESMLAVTHIMARLNYNDPNILNILGGGETVIESPAFDEIAEFMELRTTRRLIGRLIVKTLTLRFQECPPDIVSRLRDITEPAALEELQEKSVTAGSLDDFRAALPPETPSVE